MEEDNAMPSMRCYQCGKVKRCRMFTRHSNTEASIPGTVIEDLCAPCARELGYTGERDEGDEA